MKQKLGPTKFLRSLAQIISSKPRIPETLADNQLLHVILNRRSVRAFSSKLIPDDIFAAILEAGRLAPSTVNLQSWTFAVFDDLLWQQIFGHVIPFHGSRAVIVISNVSRYRQVLKDFPDSPLVEHTAAVMNASLAAMNMNIAAEALGVSSVMLSETGRSGLLDAKFLKEKLNLPEGLIPLMTIVFGYARGNYPPMPPKLPPEEVVIQGDYRPSDEAVLEGWLSQMTAGYRVSHPGSSFENQVAVYQSKINQAEQDLKELVYYRERMM